MIIKKALFSGTIISVLSDFIIFDMILMCLKFKFKFNSCPNKCAFKVTIPFSDFCFTVSIILLTLEFNTSILLVHMVFNRFNALFKS